MRWCVNHLMRPSSHVTVEGVGNCVVCTPDEDNTCCKNYYPVNITLVETREEEKGD